MYLLNKNPVHPDRGFITWASYHQHDQVNVQTALEDDPAQRLFRIGRPDSDEISSGCPVLTGAAHGYAVFTRELGPGLDLFQPVTQRVEHFDDRLAGTGQRINQERLVFRRVRKQSGFCKFDRTAKSGRQYLNGISADCRSALIDGIMEEHKGTRCGVGMMGDGVCQNGIACTISPYPDASVGTGGIGFAVDG